MRRTDVGAGHTGQVNGFEAALQGWRLLLAYLPRACAEMLARLPELPDRILRRERACLPGAGPVPPRRFPC